MPTHELKLFTSPRVTRRVGIRLFAQFFGRFIHHSKFCVVAARPDNEEFYYDALARHLTRPNDLPDRLIQALHDIETTAQALHRPDALPEADPARDPENTASDRLRQALNLWLAAAKQSEDGLAAAKQSERGSKPAAGLPSIGSPKEGECSPVPCINPTIQQSSNPLIQRSVRPSGFGSWAGCIYSYLHLSTAIYT